MFFDGRFPSLAKTATDIAVVGMFLDKSDKGWFLTESLWGPQGSVLKREPRVRDLARLLSCVLGQEALLSKCVHPVYPQEYNWVPTNCQESLTKCLKGGGGWEPASLHPVHPWEYNWVLANCQGSWTKCWEGGPASLHPRPPPGVQLGTGELSRKLDKMLRGGRTCNTSASQPVGVPILLCASFERD